MRAGLHEKFIPVDLHRHMVRKPEGKRVARFFSKRCIVTPRMYQPGFAVYIELCTRRMMLATFRRLFKGKPNKTQCNAKVCWVAEAIYVSASFQDRARSAATELGPETIETLAELFHSEHTPPPELKDQFPGLGQWMSARQFAIFEIFYFCGAPALSVLRRTAFGEYDWTQGNAIEILCRLAADGIESCQIVEELKTHLPTMREEAHYYAAGPLAKRAKENVKLNEIVNQLLMVPEFKESYEHVVQGA